MDSFIAEVRVRGFRVTDERGPHVETEYTVIATSGEARDHLAEFTGVHNALVKALTTLARAGHIDALQEAVANSTS